VHIRKGIGKKCQNSTINPPQGGASELERRCPAVKKGKKGQKKQKKKKGVHGKGAIAVNPDMDNRTHQPSAHFIAFSQNNKG